MVRANPTHIHSHNCLPCRFGTVIWAQASYLPPSACAPSQAQAHHDRQRGPLLPQPPATNASFLIVVIISKVCLCSKCDV